MAELIAIGQLKSQIPWWPFSTDSTYRWIRIGRLPAVRIGRRYFVTRELLDKWIAERSTEAP
jgi:excisionase family DNA binding protein